ncbi:MAG: transglutaminase domain-containing protein [Planctomycetes bacterium]|nr:transglutaminase domain-containing protein [Planctomycetota bacterium]
MFEFSYEATIPVPSGCERLEAWVPVASTDPGVQSVDLLRWKASAGTATITRDEVYGNRMIHVVTERPQEPLTISWRAKILRSTDVGQGRGPVHARYVQSTAFVPLEGRAKQMAIDLGITDAALTTEQRARRIYDDVLAGMAYDKNHDGWGMGSFEHATKVCKGNCTDFHSRFLGVGRAAGIPVRFTMGIPLGTAKTGSVNGYHCWAHYRDDGTWHPVDISEADKVFATDPKKADWFFGHLDPDRVSISFGRDVQLEPPAKSGPRNFFVYPYAEADGREIPMDKSAWTFRWEELD